MTPATGSSNAPQAGAWSPNPPRTLCVAETYPWPARDGYTLRLSNMVAALRRRGPVDLLCLDGSGRRRDPPPEGVTVIDAPEGPEAMPRIWMPAWIRSGLPRRLVRRDFTEAARVAALVDRDRYDLTFFSHVDSWFPTHGALGGGASIVDFDNLEDVLAATTRTMGPMRSPDAGLVTRAAARGRFAVASWFNLVDERRWARVQREAATGVDRVLVCSHLDVTRSGCANAVAVPNGYTLAWEPVDHTEVRDRDRPVFLFVGLMGYPPNVDAVRWFATEVLGRLRTAVPGAVFRVVGREADSVAVLGSIDGVEIVGEVESLRPELEGADVAVVPLRSGAGTRLKVVEAMANRIPIVSTTIGTEGIEVRDGEHVVLADGAEGFAEACVRAVGDPALRRRLADAAWECYEENYRWSSIGDRLLRIADEVVASPRGFVARNRRPSRDFRATKPVREADGSGVVGGPVADDGR
ncbi:MAG: glycosyltransferase family 4 protein [Microthrixaceae bacterium]